MGTSNDIHYAYAFQSSFDLLNQQVGSRLLSYVSTDVINNAQYKFFNQIGAVTSGTAITAGSQATTVINGSTHYRRAVTLAGKAWTDTLDDFELIEMVADPSSANVQSAIQYYNRVGIDDVIISAIEASAVVGQFGGSTESYDSTMTVSGTDMFDLFREASLNLNANEIGEGGRIIVMPAYMVDKLYNTSEFINNQYAFATRANTSSFGGGYVGSWLGFDIIRSERTGADSTAYYWQKDCVKFCVGGGSKGMSVTINERPDMNNDKQIQLKFFTGATRMNEDGCGKMLYA